MDTLGQVLWFSMFATPLITIPLMWKVLPINKVLRILIGLFLALVLSFLLYYVSLRIIFRDGMGPG